MQRETMYVNPDAIHAINMTSRELVFIGGWKIEMTQESFKELTAGLNWEGDEQLDAQQQR
jgi:hypothetical protein